MKIHTDKLAPVDVYDAARIARVHLDTFDDSGSRSRDHAFNIKLQGESRRRPNFGGEGFAATWDQWGVFLSVLFDRDPEMVTPYYADKGAFHQATDWRFTRQGDSYWPSDAHGDHHFEGTGVPYVNACSKCTAVRRWGPAA